jgi:hypothetical protein
MIGSVCTLTRHWKSDHLALCWVSRKGYVCGGRWPLVSHPLGHRLSGSGSCSVLP